VFKNERPDKGTKSSFYVEQHPIYKAPDGEYTAGAGMPMDLKTTEKIFNSLAKANTLQVSFKGLIPENVIYFQYKDFNSKLIWWEPAQKRRLFFQEKDSVEIDLPAVLFQVKNTSVYVYALKGSKRPTSGTTLFELGLPNINDGKVCMGNVKIKKNHKYAEDIMREVSDGFWKSEFTGDYLDNDEIKSLAKPKSLKITIGKLIAHEAHD
jgi:PRTRC genetic system protein B